jgi:hypothetical protein
MPKVRINGEIKLRVSLLHLFCIDKIAGRVRIVDEI